MPSITTLFNNDTKDQIDKPQVDTNKTMGENHPDFHNLVSVAKSKEFGKSNAEFLGGTAIQSLSLVAETYAAVISNVPAALMFAGTYALGTAAVFHGIYGNKQLEDFAKVIANNPEKDVKISQGVKNKLLKYSKISDLKYTENPVTVLNSILVVPDKEYKALVKATKAKLKASVRGKIGKHGKKAAAPTPESLIVNPPMMKV
ncbi:MAG: hypothetical protein LBM38_01915 [Clostridiales bacterium]|jgi:hypothetical protein|nr:hypothetical protein [Clostridiales bacterium]